MTGADGGASLHDDLAQAYDQIFRPADPVDEAIKILVAEEKARREARKVRADAELLAKVQERLGEIQAKLEKKGD